MSLGVYLSLGSGSNDPSGFLGKVLDRRMPLSTALSNAGKPLLLVSVTLTISPLGNWRTSKNAAELSLLECASRYTILLFIYSPSLFSYCSLLRLVPAEVEPVFGTPPVILASSSALSFLASSGSNRASGFLGSGLGSTLGSGFLGSGFFGSGFFSTFGSGLGSVFLGSVFLGF